MRRLRIYINSRIMFQSKNIVYADPGKYLIGNHKVGYQFPGELSEFEEKDVDINIVKKGNRYVYNNGLFGVRIAKNASYSDIKAMLVKIRYSNDDQIAIIINRDDSEEDNLKFQQMQEWRIWCTKLAKEIIKVMNE